MRMYGKDGELSRGDGEPSDEMRDLITVLLDN